MTAVNWENTSAITGNGNTTIGEMDHDGSLYLFAGGATYDSAVLKVQWSLDGTTWVDSGLTLSANGVDPGEAANTIPGGSSLRLNVSGVVTACAFAAGTIRVVEKDSEAF